jgi:hypothetical protein
MIVTQKNRNRSPSRPARPERPVRLNQLNRSNRPHRPGRLKRWALAALCLPVAYLAGGALIDQATATLFDQPSPGAAWAQGKPKEPKEIKSKGGGSLFVLEDIKIEGKVYKPQAFHVINRKELNLAWDVSDPRFRRSFLTQVVKAVKRRPF